MSIAIRTDSFIAPTLTHQNIYDAIKTAFVNVGFISPFDEYVSGTDKIQVYAVVLDNTKTYGITYLRIRLTAALVLAQQIYATWNATTHTGTGNSTEVTYTAFNTTTQINFTALNGSDEFKIVFAIQGTNAIALGFLSPANIPSWWNLNAWNYCYIVTTNAFAIYRSTTLNPYTNTENDTTLNTARMGIANAQINRRDLLPGIVFYNQTNQGISGRSSDDLAMLAGSGTVRFDTVQIPDDTKEYLVLNPASGGLVIRVF